MLEESLIADLNELDNTPMLCDMQSFLFHWYEVWVKLSQIFKLYTTL